MDVNSDTVLLPGRGYFIRSSEACKLEKKAEIAAAGKP